MSYASDTEVPVEKSKAEIERLITRYGADTFMVGHDREAAYLQFQTKNRLVRFQLPLPDRNDKQFWYTPFKKIKRTEPEAFKAWEQACRSRWRALRLCIQAKLEAVEVGITTFESEFLAHFVMPDGQTIGQHMLPKLDKYTGGHAELPWFGRAEDGK